MALTTSGTLTQEFIDKLSGELLLEPDTAYVFEQFASKQNDLGVPKGKTILFNRYPWLGGTMSESARALTQGTKVDTTSPMAVTANQVSATVKEYAGPHDGSNVVPLGISEFLAKRAEHDVIEQVGKLLRRDKDAVHDAILRDLYLAVSNVTTADGTAEGSITAGKAMTTDTLAEIKYQLDARNAPKFADGSYGLVINPKANANLLVDAGFREAVRYAAADRLFRGEVGQYLGFRILVSNNMPTKAVGSAGGVTGYQSVAFGPDAVGAGHGLMPEVRHSTDNDFGRQDLVIWLCHAAYATLDARFVQRIITT